MIKFIPQTSLILINFLLLTISVACKNNEIKSVKNNFKSYPTGEIKLPSGKKLKAYLAISPEEQQLGLSHIQSEDFKNDEAMIFLDQKYSMRQFWMPNTYFDLDIVFLSEDFYVLDIHRKLRHFPKNAPREEVPISKRVYCQHVLEIKSESPLAQEIQPGMMLDWIGPRNLLQTK